MQYGPIIRIGIKYDCARGQRKTPSVSSRLSSSFSPEHLLTGGKMWFDSVSGRLIRNTGIVFLRYFIMECRTANWKSALLLMEMEYSQLQVRCIHNIFYQSPKEFILLIRNFFEFSRWKETIKFFEKRRFFITVSSHWIVDILYLYALRFNVWCPSYRRFFSDFSDFGKTFFFDLEI